MKATNLLMAQHKEVKTLFKHIEKAKAIGEKRELFEELAQNLVAHDAIEREIFYPACKKVMGMTALLGEALVEHGVIEFSLYLADEAKGDEDFDHKVTVLREMVDHHVKEEEEDFFPKVAKALGDELLEELGARMEDRFDKVKKHDFRSPLHKNLKLVLSGATEIGPGNGARKGTTKKTAAEMETPKA